MLGLGRVMRLLDVFGIVRAFVIRLQHRSERNRAKGGTEPIQEFATMRMEHGSHRVSIDVNEFIAVQQCQAQIR